MHTHNRVMIIALQYVLFFKDKLNVEEINSIYIKGENGLNMISVFIMSNTENVKLIFLLNLYV